MSSIVVLDSPIVTKEKFAEKLGITLAAVDSMVNLRQIPTKKYGKRRFVNLAAITNDCLNGTAENFTSDEE
jgi:hypothetical protein